MAPHVHYAFIFIFQGNELIH